MEKKGEPTKKAVNLIQKASALRRFRNQHEEEFKLLTDREIEILTLVANGMQNSVIARQLDTSRATIQNHRAAIRKKLSISSEADYIKYAFAFGLISF